MNEVSQRLLTAAILIPIVLGAIFWGGIAFLLLIVVAIGIALWEFYGLMEAKGFVPLKQVGTVAGVVIALLAFVSGSDYLGDIVTAVILIAMVIQLTRKNVKAAITGISVTVLGVLYVAWLLSHAIFLRNIETELLAQYGQSFLATEPLARGDLGSFSLILVLAGTYLADTGAFFVGRKWGKSKLASRVSPQKSWEGLGGGCVASVGGVFLVKLFFGSHLEGVHCVILGLILSSAGLLGDLVESLMKRDAERKDSGEILPGHGGLLDRIDSLLFTIPITYYYIKAYYFLKL